MPSSRPADAHRVHLRRAVGFIVMSAVLPGSVQSFAGNRRLGRVAGRFFLGLVALAALTGLGLIFWPLHTMGLLLTPALTGVVRAVLWVAFVVWVVLLVDAWRLATPLKLRRRSRLGIAALAATVSLAGIGVTTVAANGFQAAGNVGEVLRGGGDSDQKAGRYNVLLLGADAAKGRDGLRPDSIHVASVDAETGRTVLFGLPRNLQRVQFPPTSPLRDLYPEGYVCDDGTCMINGIYTLGEEHADLYPEHEEPGLEAMKEAISHTLGLELNYFALVDMGGFKSLINAMGGIRLDISKPIPMGGGGSRIHGYIEPGENVRLDGYHALWFARSRVNSSDYERMARQKCVMSAMVAQLDPGTVATRFVELSEAGKNVVRTDVGTGEVAELADLALKAKRLSIASTDFSPPLIVTADPDFELIRATVAERIAASEQLDAPQPEETATVVESTTTAANTPGTSQAPASSPSAAPKPSVSGTPTVHPDRPQANTDDLEAVCAVSD